MRPTGVSIIGIGLVILGVLSFTTSLLMFGFAGISGMLNSLFTLSPQFSSNIWAGLLGMGMAALQFITGIGMLGLKSWSWYLAFVAAAWGVIQGLIGLFGSGFLSFICGGLGLVIPLVIAFYLLKPEIRALFGVGTTPS